MIYCATYDSDDLHKLSKILVRGISRVIEEMIRCGMRYFNCLNFENDFIMNVWNKTKFGLETTLYLFWTGLPAVLETLANNEYSWSHFMHALSTSSLLDFFPKTNHSPLEDGKSE